MSSYYKAGYDAFTNSGALSGDNTLDGNQACTNLWNQEFNGTGESANLEGQPGQDYSSGWIAACEGAPYGQSGVDVPGSGIKPSSPTEGY